MNIVTIPELIGDYIEATYCKGFLIGSKGRVWDHLNEIDTLGFDQAVVFIGKVVPLKDGREIAVFEDLRTFGKLKHFPLYSQVLDFIAIAGLYTPVPYPILRNMPMDVLFEWAIGQPYKFNRIMKILDNKPGVPLYEEVPSTAQITKISDITWKYDINKNLIPTIHFAEAVKHLDEFILFKELKSAVALKMNGIAIGCKIVVFDQWIKNLEQSITFYPTRCPDCNSVLKHTTFHLTCSKCKI